MKQHKGLGNPTARQRTEYYKCKKCGGVSNFEGCLKCRRKPHRVQRKRTKGWKMPPNTVYVGRPTFWGNPNRVIDSNNRLAVALYRAFFSPFQDNPGVKEMCRFMREKAKAELKGKNLACWCPLDQPCHADVLLEIANNL